MNAASLEWTDPDGNTLKVIPGSARGIVHLESQDSADGETVVITVPGTEVAQKAREICAAMHEAAGLPAPILLDRPEPLGDGIQWHVAPGITVGRGPFAASPVRLYGDEELTAEAAREIAAYLVMLADEADAGAEQSALAALRALVRAAMAGAKARSAGEIAEDVAKAVLDAGYTPPPGKP